MFDEERSKKVFIITCIACITLIIGGLTSMSVIFGIHNKRESEPLKIEVLESSYTQASHTPRGVEIMSEEEWLSSMGTTTYSTYEDYVSANEVAFTSTTPTITASGVNAKLFEYCDKYFKAYYGTERISPLFPMALSNTETQGRADYSKTFCALFPSRYVDVSKIDTFNVTDVISDEKVFNALSKEYSTRDRGCLQMSPTYGTGNDYLNSLMSGTEKEKLAKVDTSKYSSWVAGASSTPGDRFYLPDVLMRLQAAVEEDVRNFIVKGYIPNTDMQLIAMLGIEHNSGYVFSFSNHSKRVGRWNSGQSAYDYCCKLGDSKFTSELEDLASKSSSMYLSVNEAHKLYEKVYNESYTNYCSGSINAAYPIMVMYAYMKLIDAYTQ